MRRRHAVPALAVVALVGAGLLVGAALRDTLTYYRTPTEAVTGQVPAGEPVRVGGQVVPGTVRQEDGRTRFRLTDGRHEIRVVHSGAPPGTFQEGRDAVVEGVIDDGVFRSDTVAVRHGNAYRTEERTGRRTGPGDAP